jgi:hypothetical protein
MDDDDNGARRARRGVGPERRGKPEWRLGRLFEDLEQQALHPAERGRRARRPGQVVRR